jgi:hypothetical protein
MSCTDARAALLEADPVELRGEAETAVSLHLRECAACRAAADAILATEAAAGRWIETRAPRRGVADALARGRSAGRRRRWRWAAPVAAAAGIAALVFLTRPAAGPPSARPAGATAAASAPGGVAARAPAGRNVAVFATADPEIVVIWLY